MKKEEELCALIAEGKPSEEKGISNRRSRSIFISPLTISAAQVFTHLLTTCQQKPQHESQVRPLVGLTPEQSLQAWERAAQRAGTKKVTPRLLRAAMQELGLLKPAEATRVPRKTQAEKRRLIEVSIAEILVLLGQKANHATISERVQAVYTQIQSLFPKPQSQKA